MYSELQLYMPHSSKKKFGPTLEKERDDFETCLSTYQKSDISKVKGKVMEFLESVEEGLEKAKELQNTIGDELDPQNEQDMDECQAEGVIDHPDFVQSDPQNLPTQSETSTSTGIFKTVKLLSDEQRCQLTEKLDDDQRLVISIVLNHARLIQISKTVKLPLTLLNGPLLVI